MQDKNRQSEQQSAADIAREAFRRLALRRIAPTPEAYQEVYNEIAGIPAQASAEKVLAEFAVRLTKAPPEIGVVAPRLVKAVEARNWQECGNCLALLLDRGTAHPPAPQSVTDAGESSPRLDPIQRLNALGASFGDGKQTRMLRDLLARTLTLAVAALLQRAPELAEESETLARLVKEANTEQALNDVAARLKQLCFRIELKSADMAEEHELLLRLFRLLLENVGNLVEEDSWFSGQVATVQNLLSGPITYGALMDATRSMKEVVYKQGTLRNSLTEAKATVRNMVLTFIDRLGAVADSTASYHDKIDKYSQKISQAKHIGELNAILQDVMRDTRTAQTEALRSRDEMISARQEVQQAEARIQQLESELEQMSELVREDQLTGSLNRRGLDDVFERELARAERRQSPLCIALLDLDDFKKLNDTHGHSAGDDALVHLVRVIKDTLRTMDVIARFGGEEFLIVLPDTPLEEAKMVVQRLQRELTKRIFMYNNERLLITFSGGVAMHRPQEDQASLVRRADEALYKAKRAGKNRVVAEE
ncbi:GGDEF domain-containing protein [Noviherbaspirillum massiliense]|uniref:GGDEF domain-containing protein n=1 Tax=Noviherbaspirillum massiliense TaxID=1465823 RepID=UPI0002FDEDC3|nr:GGDEF domain-containing protein [Noviherbaspirillum massiliense]